MKELLTIEPSSLDRFLERWYGPPSKAMGRRPEGVPQPLAHWYEIAGCWTGPIVHQNELLDPSEFWQEGDRVVFYVENQSVWLWAFDSTMGPDPIVFDRENEDGRDWQSTTEALSEFLLQVAVFEAIWGATFGASAIDRPRADLDRVLEPLRPVPLPAWRWPGPQHRLYCGDGLLAFAGVNAPPNSSEEADSLYEVFIGAASLDALAYLDDIDIKWEHNSRKE